MRIDTDIEYKKFKLKEEIKSLNFGDMVLYNGRKNSATVVYSDEEKNK